MTSVRTCGSSSSLLVIMKEMVWHFLSKHSWGYDCNSFLWCLFWICWNQQNSYPDRQFRSFYCNLIAMYIKSKGHLTIGPSGYINWKTLFLLVPAIYLHFEDILYKSSSSNLVKPDFTFISTSWVWNSNAFAVIYSRGVCICIWCNCWHVLLTWWRWILMPVGWCKKKTVSPTILASI